MAQHSFLITGASSGLGLQLAVEALKAGHSVVATARNPTKAAQDHPEVEELGGSWLQLDVTHTDTKERVDKAVQERQVNVLVNCAGYGILGSLEDTDEDEFMAQMDTNTYGTMRCIKGVLPHFRSLGAEGHATIVNIGSIVCLTPFPATTAYAASKAAVEGLSEALAMEVGAFGIRVVLIDFGIFRTGFLHSFSKPKEGLGEAYVGGSVDGTVSFLENLAGKQPGNPTLAAKRIVEVVDGTGLAKDLVKKGYGPALRIPLGSDSFRGVTAKLEALTEAKTLETLACSTDFTDDVVAP
ncbi:hypothetical protein B0J13DRAFT_477158 [Dactylonectria estremocensis]|uniref:Uncharacterized protein n=1 Tax=Dactylonectria estremocensis TaxID=1079267 RepID=A0A9P9EMF1_9HYPO|nr:hypothetical protein B0J13DRAFT_477158 [Dactylonectria estremocensis]